jgi:hypothetical protein
MVGLEDGEGPSVVPPLLRRIQVSTAFNGLCPDSHG